MDGRLHIEKHDAVQYAFPGEVPVRVLIQVPITLPAPKKRRGK